MKQFKNGARTKLVTSKKVKIEHRCLTFTAYLEKFIDHASIKIISDDTSELVFKKNIYEESCFWSLDDEVFVALDDYVEANATEVDRLYSLLTKWSF